MQMRKVKFTVTSKEDFLRKVKCVGATDRRLNNPKIVDEWFSRCDPLTGSYHWWHVDEDGHLFCGSYPEPSYKDITHYLIYNIGDM